MTHGVKITKLYFVKVKNFLSAKDTVKEMKRQAINQEKIFVQHI